MPITTNNPFKGRQYPGEIILSTVPRTILLSYTAWQRQHGGRWDDRGGMYHPRRAALPASVNPMEAPR